MSNEQDEIKNIVAQLKRPQMQESELLQQPHWNIACADAGI
jgi:hypothetical protein